ncbi:MAG: glutamine ABC transporter ATP-binding protein GlnQ, partial [Staphylococcus equorum]|nr:glutamine ABC transporter ATP-binding protein GlnQ [Staphylococcus equorum]
MINIKNLYKSFGKNEVLKGIDFTENQGEVVDIIGPS